MKRTAILAAAALAATLGAGAATAQTIVGNWQCTDRQSLGAQAAGTMTFVSTYGPNGTHNAKVHLQMGNDRTKIAARYDYRARYSFAGNQLQESGVRVRTETFQVNGQDMTRGPIAEQVRATLERQNAAPITVSFPRPGVMEMSTPADPGRSVTCQRTG